MLKDVTSNPLEKGIKKQVHSKSWWAKFCNLLQGPTKLVMSRVSVEPMQVRAWLWQFHGVVKVRDLIPCGCWNIGRCHVYIYVDDIDYSNASYMNGTWYVECIEMNAWDIWMNNDWNDELMIILELFQRLLWMQDSHDQLTAKNALWKEQGGMNDTLVK